MAHDCQSGGAAEGIERYLHTKYVGQKRFSLEGGESLIWVSVWDDAGARDRFQEALGRGLPRLPRPASLEVGTVQGRPILLLRVGDPPDVEVVLGEGA